MKIKNWWDKQHLQRTHYASGTDIGEVWNLLGITPLIKQDINILNIGLGLGKETEEMFKKKTNVYGLDISKHPLKRFEKWLKKGYLFPEDLDKIPENFFDLAVSHLVSQHMSDEDLIKQLNTIIKSLKPNGILAMQFADTINEKIKPFSFANQQRGQCNRSIEEMEKIVNKCNGKIVWTNKRILPITERWWLAVHIKKDN